MSSEPVDPRSSRTIVVSGATGLIGSALVERLRGRGHRVRRLVRTSRGTTADDVVWDPSIGPVPPAALTDADAVVNLAGEPLARRWTSARKHAIRESRVRATAMLAQAIAKSTHKPGVFLSGSAVGYYGDGGDAVLEESSAAGSDFLARVCVDWEAAAAPAADAAVRVVLLRTGIVMSQRGGALAKLLPIFRLGGGGPLGSGRQWMSWIGLTDHIRAMEHALFTESLRGPANLVAPNPVTNAEFAATLGRVLARPALVPVPTVALELLYGEMARATLLAGQRVLPKALSAAAFEFSQPTLEGALRAELET